MLYKGRRKTDGLIPNCVKGNMHLPLEIKLTPESNCFVRASVCVHGIDTSDTLLSLWRLQKLDFSISVQGKKTKTKQEIVSFT